MKFSLPPPTVSVTTDGRCFCVHFIRLTGTRRRTHIIRQGRRVRLWQQVLVQHFRIHLSPTKQTIAAIRSRSGARGQLQQELKKGRQ